MEIIVLGPDCVNCTKLEELARQSVKEFCIEAKIAKVSDMREIMK